MWEIMTILLLVTAIVAIVFGWALMAGCCIGLAVTIRALNWRERWKA